MMQDDDKGYANAEDIETVKLKAAEHETKKLVRSDSRKHVVLVFHGIRDVGTWVNSIQSAFKGTECEVIPIGYDPVNVGQFFSWRSQAKRHEWLRKQIAAYKPDEFRVSVIAHSYGTFLLGHLLLAHHEIKLERIALCGAILPRQFEWLNVFKRNIEPHRIVNDCGAKDWWPVVARAFRPGCDSSGTFGFTQYGVKDRYHDFSHSGFLDDRFAKKYWVPWFTEGRYVESPFEKKRPAPTVLQSTLNSYGRWIYPTLFWLLVILGVVLFWGNIRSFASGFFNWRVPASSLRNQIDPTLNSWVSLSEHIEAADSSYERTRIRLNKWRAYVAQGAQPWIFKNEDPTLMVACTEFQISERDADSVSYSCHVNPRYVIKEIYAFMVTDSDDGTYAPVYRQQKPTIVGGTCFLDISYPEAGERLFLLVLVASADGSTIDANPNSWGFYMQRR